MSAKLKETQSQPDPSKQPGRNQHVPGHRTYRVIDGIVYFVRNASIYFEEFEENRFGKTDNKSIEETENVRKMMEGPIALPDTPKSDS